MTLIIDVDFPSPDTAAYVLSHIHNLSDFHFRAKFDQPFVYRNRMIGSGIFSGSCAAAGPFSCTSSAVTISCCSNPHGIIVYSFHPDGILNIGSFDSGCNNATAAAFYFDDAPGIDRGY